MAKKDYIAVADTWLSHECRQVKAGEEFSTEFPQVKVGGKLVDMRLGDNIRLVEAKKSAGKSGDDIS